MHGKEESAARIKLAGRILLQLRTGGGQPIIPSEIAHLRFLAESDEEGQMPLDKLAETVIWREGRRMGYPPAMGDPRVTWRN